MVRPRPGSLLRFCLLFALALPALAQTAGPRPSYIPYSEAQPILEALADVLPAELKQENPSRLAVVWPGWVASRDAEIRARLARGDEDSLVNFLLFGTSFTRRPRITPDDLKQLGNGEAPSSGSPPAEREQRIRELLAARVDDLVRALAAPRSNERMLFARRVVERGGYDLGTAAGRQKVKEYFAANLDRVLKEQRSYTQALQAARLLGDSSEEFAERSKLFRDRGLSLDTSLLPNFAIEESLKAMQAHGLLARGNVRRVGIIGPGLDFADKAAGYDFYPQQTIQPFAVIDTLLRLGLAKAEALELTTFDISPRVNDHLARARHRARRRIGYTVQLPRDTRRHWKPDALRYWERFGDQIGVPAQPVAVPAGVSDLKLRAVRIRAAIVARVMPADLNIVLQRLEPRAPADGFDLLIGTNIFVYYDVFEQSLALANVERMLRPGGFLLSNNALLELPSSRMHSVDYLTVVYSDQADDGDHIVWYQRRND